MNRLALLTIAGLLAYLAVRGGGGGEATKGPAPWPPFPWLAYTPADDLLDPYPGGPSYTLQAADTLAAVLTPALVALGDTPAACAALRVLDGLEDVAAEALLDGEAKAGHRNRGRALVLRTLEAKGQLVEAWTEPAPCAMLR